MSELNVVMHISRNKQIKQKVMAIYVIAALLFQIYLLATMALNPSQVNNKNWLSEAQGEKILLCTAEGFKWVDIRELIGDNAERPVSLNDIHEPLKFQCPLLEMCQFSIVMMALVLAAIAVWLYRVTSSYLDYSHTYCFNKIYLTLAPKQSPPSGFSA